MGDRSVTTTEAERGALGSSWATAASAVHWDIRPFIDGSLVASSSDETYPNVNPATEAPLCDVGVGAAADVDAAVNVAKRRFNEGVWSGLSAGRRAEILRTLGDLIAERREELALLDCLEMGKPITAALADAEMARSLLRNWADCAERLLGESVPLTPGALGFNCYQPRGVVGAITAWNFPVVNVIYKIAPALAAGNTVVLKPSEIAPSSSLKLAELAVEAGVPAGVLNVVPGVGKTVGEALAHHPDIDFLSFTGSTVTGRHVMQLAGANGTPVLLECGGKSPHVVFDDADDLEAIAEAVVAGVLVNQGQVCTAHTRLLVQAGIKDELVQEVVKRAREYRPGDPLDEATTFGPLASSEQRDRVSRYMTAGIDAGAELLLEGTVQDSGGCYVTPTIFGGVDQSMSIVQEEIFGPVLCVQSFTSESEAIDLANGTSYGLTSTVWTRDLARARRLACAVKSAHVVVRTSGAEEWCNYRILSYEPSKASGFGSEIGVRGLQSYSTLKAVYLFGA